MTETLANGYSSESAPRELSNEYQHDRRWMVFKNLCICVLWTKVALVLEGLRISRFLLYTGRYCSLKLCSGSSDERRFDSVSETTEVFVVIQLAPFIDRQLKM